MWRHHHADYGGFPMSIIFWLLLFLLMVIVMITLFFLFRNKNQSNEDKAISILRERYARGEINKEEYKERLQELSPK